jgi:DNA-directed RNA polymerase subunit RPC12/RpoP
MITCHGGDRQQWKFDAIFNVNCPNCGIIVELFQDDKQRKCPHCQHIVHNNQKHKGCPRRHTALSTDRRILCNNCPKFTRSKVRFYGWSV